MWVCFFGLVESVVGIAIFAIFAHSCLRHRFSAVCVSVCMLSTVMLRAPSSRRVSYRVCTTVIATRYVINTETLTFPRNSHVPKKPEDPAH
ncbi:hypothetical protein QBC33DRAFT_526125 [Phialemonium atrogriseum]|uniref:Uncharacterized protein n=1 Tax=Phialemonium atrogriseum TaxID=1093897 RepID=A0AAJ0FQ41_9PEZI|nr:uncharacterized protein QBC33DRAFT_526125 [Phialemonium atrogriseum]KAK1770908.1 hypothetical protein QBC33DRAFT_526125 [Phialemonium atrogriseum]